MVEQKKIKIENLKDDNYLVRIIDSTPVDKLSCVIKEGSVGAGYLSKELISKMIAVMKRNGRDLTHLCVSSEGAADMRKWSDEDIDLPVDTSLIWNITIYERNCLKADKVYGYNFVEGTADAVCVGTINRF